MKTLKEAIAEVLVGMNSFSIYEITSKLRKLVQVGAIELDTPLESYPGFNKKLNRVEHKEVKSVFESNFSADFRVVTRNGFRVFEKNAPNKQSSISQIKIRTQNKDEAQDKIARYVSNFEKRNGVKPTARQIQSALKRGRGPGYKSIPRSLIRVVVNNIN